MSIAYSDVTNKDGLLQQIEQCCGFEDGMITGNATLKAQFTGKINVAQDEVMAEALKAGGWNVDDFNHTHDPFITTNLVSGQRDYHFTTDEEGSLILDIYKVMVANSSGIFSELDPVDQQGEGQDAMWDGLNSTGIPAVYDKTGNGIFLDPIPNYSKTDGLKLFINRESTYFAVSDTTKISGIDGLCHDYLYLKPSYEYARDKGLQNAERLFRDLQVSMKKIKGRYGGRARDERNIISMAPIRFM